MHFGQRLFPFFFLLYKYQIRFLFYKRCKKEFDSFFDKTNCITKKIIKLSALHSKACGAFFWYKKAPALGIPGREESTWKAVNCGVRLPLLICIFFESYSFFNKHKYLTILRTYLEISLFLSVVTSLSTILPTVLDRVSTFIEVVIPIDIVLF